MTFILFIVIFLNNQLLLNKMGPWSSGYVLLVFSAADKRRLYTAEVAGSTRSRYSESPAGPINGLVV